MGLESFYDDYVAPALPVVLGTVGFAVGGPVGGAAGYYVGKEMQKPGEAPNAGLPPTPADIAKQEADKAALRRQRAAALLAGGAKANILTSPLGIPGGSESNQVQGRKTLLGS